MWIKVWRGNIGEYLRLEGDEKIVEEIIAKDIITVNSN